MIAEDRRIALDERVYMLLGQQVGRDALDLIGRAAVQRRERDAVGDLRRDGGNERRLLREQLRQDLAALGKHRQLRGILHGFDVVVDLRATDSLEVIADGHVEHKAVRVAVMPDLCHDLQGEPRLDILIERLHDLQLRGPLLIVALVVCKDAGTRHAGGKLRAVHLLNGLDLKEARACDVGGDDILRQLAVRACSGAERAFDLLAEDGKRLGRVGDPALVHAEDLASLLPLCEDPVHQAAERNGIHFLRHGIILL